MKVFRYIKGIRIHQRIDPILVDAVQRLAKLKSNLLITASKVSTLKKLAGHVHWYDGEDHESLQMRHCRLVEDF